jgi:glycerol-3-phosphate dehydrogenase subunit B
VHLKAAVHYDLIVIGMGLSGLMAAKTAVERGRKTLVLGSGMGCLSLFSHTVDVLAGISNENVMRESLSNWIDQHPHHPYARAGWQGISDGLLSFRSLFPDRYVFQAAELGEFTVLTAAGTLRTAYLVPNTMALKEASRWEDTLIVGFEPFTDFFAETVAGRLNCRALTLPLPQKLRGNISSSAMARLMDQPSFRETVGIQVKNNLSRERRIGFPAVLGLRDPFGVKCDLEQIIGAEVFEIPALPPSIPGIRIFNRFREWLLRRGATFLMGQSASEVDVRGNRCRQLFVSGPAAPRPYSADRFLLATGRFASGGLVDRGGHIRESLFDVDVDQPPSKEGWFENVFFADRPHPIHRAGISVDGTFRPVDRAGRRTLENVWVAGSILGHHDFMHEKSREGIEIATGHTAALRAVEI